MRVLGKLFERRRDMSWKQKNYTTLHDRGAPAWDSGSAGPGVQAGSLRSSTIESRRPLTRIRTPKNITRVRTKTVENLEKLLLRSTVPCQPFASESCLYLTYVRKDLTGRIGAGGYGRDLDGRLGGLNDELGL